MVSPIFTQPQSPKAYFPQEWLYYNQSPQPIQTLDGRQEDVSKIWVLGSLPGSLDQSCPDSPRQ